MVLNILQSKWFTIVSIAIIFLAAAAIAKRKPALVALDREERRIETELHDAERKRLELEAGREFFQSQAYLERQARMHLNYQKPGERVVYVYHAAEEQREVQDAPRPLKHWQQWWYYLTSKSRE